MILTTKSTKEKVQKTRRRACPSFVFFVPALCALCGFLFTSPAYAQQRYEFVHKQMGTTFRIVLYAGDDSLAHRAAKAAFDRIDTLNNIMSDYLPGSELNRLSASSGSGQAVMLSDDLFQVLEEAEAVSQQSAGAFDVSVGPLVQLWRVARRKHRLPDSTAIGEALLSVGYQAIELDPQSCSARLHKAQMRLDLGGIAKGYAVDEALRELRALGIETALVDGGGDIAVGAPPPGKRGWEIEMESLDENGARQLRKLEMAHAAIATSGDTYRYLELGGKRYSHILDPRTGQALTDQCKVTVIAPTATLADAWASALSVMDPAQSFSLTATRTWLQFHLLCEDEQQQAAVKSTPGFTH